MPRKKIKKLKEKSAENPPPPKKQIPRKTREKAVLKKIIELGGNYSGKINVITAEIAAEHPNKIPPDKHTIAKDIYKIFDDVPEDILYREKADTAQELLYTDSVMKAMMNKVRAYVGELYDEKGNPVKLVVSTDEVIKILDAFRRYKEGKINIAEAYGLKKKVADQLEVKSEGRDEITLKTFQKYYVPGKKPKKISK